nr:tRNA (adenosine(37)-N6)-dimethylallyltransferase MiaA [uncultured Ruminococcus sp.]
MSEKQKIISVVGPTASGKTRLAVELAKIFDGEVISADSMQIYQGMKIATAKPDKAEMQGIPHHLMDFLILAGGTGLYVDSLLRNIKFSEEERDEKLSRELWQKYEEEGIDSLLQKLSVIDLPSYERLKEGRNPKRIIRAIEFYYTTGKTITEQNEMSRLEESPYDAIKIGLGFLDRGKLYERINLRVDLMLRNGLLEEARQVLGSELSQTSVKAIGYKELMPYFEGEQSLEECIEKLKRETRRYAKRQLTWFKRDKEINWLYVEEEPNFEALLDKAVQIIKGRLYG